MVKVFRDFTCAKNLFDFDFNRGTHSRPKTLKKTHVKSIRPWPFIRFERSQGREDFFISDWKFKLGNIFHIQSARPKRGLPLLQVSTMIGGSGELKEPFSDESSNFMFPTQPISHSVFHTSDTVSSPSNQSQVMKKHSISITFNHLRNSRLHAPKFSLQISYMC